MLSTMAVSKTFEQYTAELYRTEVFCFFLLLWPITGIFGAADLSCED